MLWSIATNSYAFDGGNNNKEIAKVKKSISRFSKKRTFGRHFEVENHCLLDNQEEKDERSEDSRCLAAPSDVYCQVLTTIQSLQGVGTRIGVAIYPPQKLFELHCVYLI